MTKNLFHAAAAGSRCNWLGQLFPVVVYFCACAAAIADRGLYKIILEFVVRH